MNSDIPTLRIVLSRREADEMAEDFEPHADILAVTEQSGRTEYVFYPADDESSAALAETLNAALAIRLPAPTPCVRPDRVRAEDWRESWKASFRPVRISAQTLIAPPWHERGLDDPDRILRIYPGMSFGTGQHFTTQSCLALLETCIEAAPANAFLDIGCGSGVLAILAAQMGTKQVNAMDFDPECVRCTQENMITNNTPDIHVEQGDLAEWEPDRQWDLVCANMISSRLYAYLETITGCVAPAGRLIIGGLLRHEQADMQEALCAHGYSMDTSRLDDTWCTLLAVNKDGGR